jgi:hypothetical protein
MRDGNDETTTRAHLKSPPIHIARLQNISIVHIILSARPFYLTKMVIGRVVGLSSILCFKPMLIIAGHATHKFIDIVPVGLRSAPINQMPKTG